MSELRISLEEVRRALSLSDFDPDPARQRMAPLTRAMRRPDLPGGPKLAGVLVLLCADPHSEGLHLVLMRRAETDGVHSGQMSFPGGRQEPGESFEQTAIREALEEIGAKQVEVLGALTPLYILPSDFEVHPIVGYVPYRPIWTPQPTEVAEVVEAPLELLFDEQIKGSEIAQRGELTLNIRYYLINGNKVWGATAIILSELEHRLRAVLHLNGVS